MKKMAMGMQAVRLRNRSLDMSTSGELFARISRGECDDALRRLYGGAPAALARQRERYCDALLHFEKYYGRGREVRIYSAPGRAELGGNHTDHQNGIALAAAVSLDIIAVVAKSAMPLIRTKSYGFDKLDVVDVACAAPQAAESTHSASLIRGIAQELIRRGGAAGGFDAYTTSDVLRGSGLSSSAAFEVVIGTILNHEYNEGRFSPLELAQVGQYAENTYFGKPTGLLDTLSCAAGRRHLRRFRQPEAPQHPAHGHGNLEKRGLPAVHHRHGRQPQRADRGVCRYPRGDGIGGPPVPPAGPARGAKCRRAAGCAAAASAAACGDRAVLRALHFYGECSPCPRRNTAALQHRDFPALFSRLWPKADAPPFEYNQNAYCGAHPRHAADSRWRWPLSQQILLAGTGASRLQGGGFAGTIQAFVPAGALEAYRAAMESVFGEGSCRLVTVRGIGCTVAVS
jgi:galactokinase